MVFPSQEKDQLKITCATRQVKNLKQERIVREKLVSRKRELVFTYAYYTRLLDLIAEIVDRSSELSEVAIALSQSQTDQDVLRRLEVLANFDSIYEAVDGLLAQAEGDEEVGFF
jgi:hypothetical protein